MIQGEVNAAVQQELAVRQNLQPGQLPSLPMIASPANIALNDPQNSSMQGSLETANNQNLNRSSPVSQNLEQHPECGSTYQPIPSPAIRTSPTRTEPNVHWGTVNPHQLDIGY